MVSTSSKNKFLITGIFLVFAAPLWVWFVAPSILQLPKDFSFTAEVVSVDDLYNEERGAYAGGVFSKTDYEYKTVSSENGVSVIKNSFSVRTPDDKPIFAVERLYGVNRVTGAHVEGGGDENRAGYLFAPKNLKEGEPFTYWHINYDGPAHMEYVGTEKLYGLTVYRYETRYEGVSIDQTENLSFLPGVGKTRGVLLEPYLQTWVEPLTGRLVKYQDDTVAYYYDLQTHEKLNPWNHFSNTFRESSVESNVRSVQWDRTKAQTVEWYIPILLFLTGLFFALKGAGLLDAMVKRTSLDRVRAVTGWFVIGVTLSTIIGWAFGIESLIRIIPIAGAMNPVTALCFVALGIVILLKNKADRLTVLIGVGVALIGAFRLANIYGLIAVSPDLLLFKDTVTSFAVPARMSAYTAFSFLLLGLVPLAGILRSLKKIRLTEIFSSVVLLFTLLALISFLFDSLALTAIPIFFSAAVHTAILFLLTSTLFYVLYREKDEYSLSFKSWLSVSGILLMSIIVTIGFASTVDLLLTNQARTAFETEATRAVEAIEGRVRIYTNVLDGAKGLLSASQNVERDEWKAYVESIDIKKEYPGIQGIGYSIFVAPVDREAHIAAIRQEGFGSYTIKPAGVRDPYTAVIYLEPMDTRNIQAFGYDMFSDPVRRLAMEQARDTGDPTMSGRVTLVGEIDEDVQPGFLVYEPFYRNGSLHNTQDEKRASILGYSYAPFRARDFVEGIIGQSGLRDIALRITDGTGTDENSVLYDDGKKLKDGEIPRFRETITTYVAGRPWAITFTSTGTYGGTLFSRFALPGITLLGILVSMLLSFVFYTLASSRQRAVAYADQVTVDLKEAKAKDEAVLASIGDGLVATDREGRIVLTNKIFEQLLGWSENEVRGKKLTEVVIVLDANQKPIPESERLVTKALGKRTTTTTTTTVNYQKKDGTIFPVATTVSPILSGDELIGAVEIFRDITKEKDIDRAKTEFVSLASHQLRTPLTSVNWYAEMLLAGDAGKLNSEQHQYISEMYNGNQRMVQLVNALLNVSRIDLGTFAVDPEPTNAAEITDSVLAELQSKIQEKKLKLTKNYDQKLPIIQADPKLLRIIIQNLLSNAVKYTPEKGLVTVTLAQDKKNLLFTVKDTGCGIPKAQQDKIFTKLFRADNAKEIDNDGNGLGMYLVKAVIIAINGQIRFESEENKGTTFYVIIPLSGMKKKEGAKTLDS